MTPRDFCYWLQGPLELDDCERPALDAQQVGIIKKHLELALSETLDPVRYADANKGATFCYWLDGFLLCDIGVALTVEKVRLIQSRLSRAFVEEIDPTFENGHELDQIHNGTAGGSNPSQARRRPDEPRIEVYC